MSAALLAALLGSAAIAAIASGQSVPRSLHWRALDVTARLDEAGRLHVRERQAMVFSGDWNGGERRFRLGWDHELQLQGIYREDPETHSLVPLVENDSLSLRDQFAWHDTTTLRWRSRFPSDPLFHDTEIVYVLDYTLDNVLRPRNGGYVLDHDFAFPDRPGPILSFTLDLSLHDAFRPEAAFSKEIRRDHLQPGESAVVTLLLDHIGTARLAGIRTGAPGALRGALALALSSALAAIGFLFYRDEDAIGRFAPLTPHSSIDAAWLEENVFSMLPEEVGAAWDDSTAAPEVAAILARMVSEGKLRTEVIRKDGFFRSEENLRMELLVDRSTLQGYEIALVRALFVRGDVTDTAAIRKHYEKRGFDPTSRIREPLKRRVARILGKAGAPRPISRKPALLLLAASVLTASLAGVLDPKGLVPILPFLAAAVFVYLFGFIAAAIYRKRVERLFAFSFTFLVPAALVAAVTLALLAWNPWRSGVLALAALTLFVLALATSLFNVAKFRDGSLALATRKKLASARRYFGYELSKKEPRLEDRWFPYLIAFELGPDVDRWFRAYGGSSSGGPSSFPSPGESSGTGSGGASRSTWTGGGGAFGGAGATASWAAAVGTVAAGVTAPSSNGGGSGGGGGGSSGGGGGGGW